MNSGYTERDLNCVVNTFDLAIQLYTGRYEANGKVFLAHVIGTASILCRLKQPVEVVAAGLIHNIYMNADFGYRNLGRLSARRKMVKSAVNAKAEDYAHRFPALHFQRLSGVLEELDNLSEIDREVLLIYLADELEKCLDRGLLYYGNQRGEMENIERNGQTFITIAEKLGYPTLARELESVFRTITTTEVPCEMCSQSDHSRSFVIIPKSYRKRFSLALFESHKFKNSLSYSVCRRIFRWFVPAVDYGAGLISAQRE